MRIVVPIQERRRDWRPAILSALLALVVFSITLRGTYVFDDLFIVDQDPRVTHPSLWGRFWTQGYFPDGVDNLYRPVTSMSYGVQRWLNGDRPWAFHLVNLLLYGMCAAAVAELARRMGGSGVGYIVGLLFAVHPIHTEVVAGLVGRADLLCTLFFVGALILMMRRPLSMRRVWAIFACCVLSLLTKEQGLLLPLVLLVFAVCSKVEGQPDSSHPADDRRDIQVLCVPKRKNSPAMVLALLLCWFWAGYLIFREWLLPMEWDRGMLDWTLNPMVRAHGWSIWLVPIEMLGRYLQLLVVPWKLSIDYGGYVIGWVAHPGDPYLYIGLAGIAVWLVLLIWAACRRRGYIIFCLLTMALTWGMVSNLGILIGANFAERLIFLPSAFLLIPVAMGLVRLRRTILVPVMAILLILGGLRSFTYARHWNNRLGLYEYALAQQPDSVRIQILVAVELKKLGQLQRADQIISVSRRQYPDYWFVWLDSFDVAILQGRLSAAQRYLLTAAKLVPDPSYLWSRQEALQALKARRAASTAGPTSRRFPAASSAGAGAAR